MGVQCKYNITTTELADYLFRWKIAEIYKSIFFEFVHARRIMSHKELWDVKRFKTAKIFIHAWLNLIDNVTKDYNRKLYQIQQLSSSSLQKSKDASDGHWLYIFNQVHCYLKFIFEYICWCEKANFTKKNISHSMAKHAALFVLHIFWLLKSIDQAYIIHQQK